MKLILTLVGLCFGMLLHSQQTNIDKAKYEVKNGKIYLEKKDVTESISEETRKSILKDARLTEKEKKRTEKKLKKAEKTLKKKEKNISNLENAQVKLKKAEAKYQRLKTKGKLSPVDDSKWSKRLEKLNAKVKKYQKRL